jgi:pheromone shutdown protein TraB
VPDGPGTKANEPAPGGSPVATPSPPFPVLVIGTAHVVDLTDPLRGLLAGRPLDGIALELDAERAQVLLPPEGGSPGPGGRRATPAPFFARLWAVVQRRLGADLGAGVPGAEMRTAAAIARERRLPIFLIDDPVRATLLRLVRTMPLRERAMLLVGSIAGLLVPTRVVAEEMDRYTEQPGEMLDDLRRISPTVARVLIDERNERMAERLAAIRARGFARLAAVVGDAHVSGLAEALARRGLSAEPVRFRELRTVTGPSSSPS